MNRQPNTLYDSGDGSGRSAAPFVRLLGLSKAYQEGDRQRVVLQNASAEFHRGEFVALLGRSGSGKSTLLKLLSFLLPQVSGELRFLGETQDKKDDARLHATLLLQEPYLLRRSVFENIAYGLNVQRLSQAVIRERVGRVMELVELTGYENRQPNQLSGGQQQRVAIARALANDPPLVVGDEPTGNLDRMSAAVVFEIFHELREQGRTVLVVSHDREILTDVPRLMVLTDGMIESTTLEAAARRRSQELQEVKLRTQERRAAHSATQEHEAFHS